MNKTEERIKSDTGGEKCAKLAQMADIPASVLLELMEHYGKGRAKYPGDMDGPNYAKGYPWSLSYNAAMRHLLQFWGGEDIDPETGSKHVIAAAWHCICLALFSEIHPDKDDRWEYARIRKLVKNSFAESVDQVIWETEHPINGPGNVRTTRSLTQAEYEQYQREREEENMN